MLVQRLISVLLRPGGRIGSIPTPVSPDRRI